MFDRLSNFVKDESNRAILQWIGGAAAVVIGGLWTVFSFFYEKTAEKAPPPTFQVEQNGTNLAAAHDINVNELTINPDAKEVIKEATAPFNEQLQKLIVEVAREKGVQPAPLRATLAKLGEKNISNEDIPKRLAVMADELVKYRNRTDSFKNGPPELDMIAREAQALVDKGDFDAARATLSRGRLAAQKLRGDASRREAEMAAQEAKVDELQGNYSSAAAKYAEAANIVAPFDAQAQFDYLTQQATTLAGLGFELGDNEAFNAASNLFRKSRAVADGIAVKVAHSGLVLFGEFLRAMGVREFTVADSVCSTTP